MLDTLARPAKAVAAICVVPTAMTLGKNLRGVWKVLYALSILMLLISLVGSELMESEGKPLALERKNEVPSSYTDDPSISVAKGANSTKRKILVDSGANIMLAPNDNNMTNVRRSRFNVTGVNGNSSTEFVGQLPMMVTNTGHHLHIDADCPISLPEHANSERTILATRYLNDMGLTVVFQNHTTVLLKTSSVRLSGVVVHQEAFTDNLAYIHLQDNGVPRKSPGRVQVVNTSSPLPRAQLRANLKGNIILTAQELHAKSRVEKCLTEEEEENDLPMQGGEINTTSRSRYKLEKRSWERWHSKLGHPSLTVMKTAAVNHSDVSSMTTQMCDCDSCHHPRPNIPTRTWSLPPRRTWP